MTYPNILGLTAEHMKNEEDVGDNGYSPYILRVFSVNSAFSVVNLKCNILKLLSNKRKAFSLVKVSIYRKVCFNGTSNEI